MKFSAIVLSFLTPLSLAADCYKDGLYMSGKQGRDVSEQLLGFCAEALANDYPSQTGIYMCSNFRDGTDAHWDFYVLNFYNGRVFNSIEGCRLVFQHIIDSCWQGGESRAVGDGYNWVFVADPNFGRCPRLAVGPTGSGSDGNSGFEVKTISLNG